MTSMTHAQAIVLSIGLVVACWFLVVWTQAETQPEPKPTPPGPAPVEQPAEVGNPIQLYRDVRKLVTFAEQVQVAIQAASRELAKADMQDEMPAVEPTVEPAEQPETTKTWTPPERQAIVYFYTETRDVAHQQATKLLRAGHSVYRVPADRMDIWRQHSVDRVPTWLVIRDGRVIYRSSLCPEFREQPKPEPVRRAPVQQPAVRYYSPPVYQTPTYRSVPTYRSGSTCGPWGCG